jgi:hypothetical protein
MPSRDCGTAFSFLENGTTDFADKRNLCGELGVSLSLLNASIPPLCRNPYPGKNIDALAGA